MAAEIYFRMEGLGSGNGLLRFEHRQLFHLVWRPLRGHAYLAG